ncbi:MAG: bifunctional diaminohydroxyphosphoribosylaminopyrimidine deaminase/5-amino-6-(5-phosphoribosylamino)uracil reductase RibD [Spirochaetota bacterium]|nr:bifunctional diaminohydroxyphosphoribosylaminopyrimidine deaminase/5-amino-6-(5-phosphoribosylamino)uracil reductase RibD [Spirochaetota bacterium]
MVTSTENKKFLKMALDLADKVKGNTSPNPSVGAILVKDNRIIGEGATQKAGEDHAEVVAIKKAGDNVAGSTLYVTLEPCCIQGKTPPCTDLIIEKKIKNVVVGSLDPNPKVNGNGISTLKKAGIKVEYGFMEKEINELNEDFAKFIKTKTPFCIAKYAMTLDGKIATFKGDSKWISNEKSRNFVHKLRNRVDGIMVGVNTIIYDNPKLTVRLDNKFKNPIRIVLDSHGRTPINSNVLQDDVETIFVLKKNSTFYREQKEKFIEVCLKQGKKVIFDDTEGNKINIKNIIKELGKLDITSILIEGGSELLASALVERIIDKIICFIAPKIVLGKEGTFPFGGIGFEKIEDAFLLDKIIPTQIGNDIMINGYVKYESN